jgi:signal transduction histidine kinase
VTSVEMSDLTLGSLRPVLRLGTTIRRVLSVPLFGKLIGANVLIFAGASVALWPGLEHVSRVELVIGGVAILLACAANIVLVRLALSPIQELERVAERVSAGEFSARVGPSSVADSRIASLISTMNALLDALAAERERIQRLGAEVIFSQDAERSMISREIHDSIAQTLAAVRFQLAAAGESSRDTQLRNQMTAMRVVVGRAIEDLRTISETLSPRVAEDLGLDAALESLAAQTLERSGIAVDLLVGSGVSRIPMNVASTLFRVAQEGLRNVELHSRATSATLSVDVRNGVIRLELWDDGRGFDASVLQSQNRKTGLSLLSDRVALSGGSLIIDSHGDQGTRIVAEMQGEAVAAA